MNNIEVILNQKQLTKAEIDNVVTSINTGIVNGITNPLEVYLKAKYLNEVSAALLKEIKSVTESEIEKYSKDDRTLYGAKFTTRNGYAILAYEEDEEYAQLAAKLKARKDLLSDAYKAHQKGNRVIDTEGEIVEPPVVASYTADSIVITFPKS